MYYTTFTPSTDSDWLDSFREPDELYHMAIKLAQLSTMKVKVSAIIYTYHNMLGSGINQPLKGFKPLNPWLKNYYTLHAEAAALAATWYQLKPTQEDINIIVVRLGQNGQPLLARPCQQCQQLLNLAKIKNIFYSTNEGKVDRLTS